MPEQHEPTAEALKLKHAIFQALSEGSDFSSVISLWCDATNSEAAKSSKDSCFHRNLVDQISASCIFECSQTKAQDQLFPPQIVNKKEKPGDLVILDLFLKGPDSISATARALILDLGPLKLLFAYSHSLQFESYLFEYVLHSSSSATSSVASSSATSSVASSSAATAPSSVIDVDVDSDLEHEAFADDTNGAASPD
ncbi:hypothetical protein BT96DRAFT_1044977 [Gymnopus androsaceus JB14]|uniref:Uncharacterized protein n=1 Tax=Gymnopus androsaceus JB14 TaxID=1447944 RepID=A0A6A4HBR1_9AGAR|nr:hypothetical protein BT96DRAFT_1044977 [Gymnopus androsaceus JB14]